MKYSNTQPTAPGGFFWVRRLDGSDLRDRVAEVISCDPLDKRPVGALKLAFTQCEESRSLDGYEFAGPIPLPFCEPKQTQDHGAGVVRESFDM